jgi:hypothetical protein
MNGYGRDLSAAKRSQNSIVQLRESPEKSPERERPLMIGIQRQHSGYGTWEDWILPLLARRAIDRNDTETD